MYYPLFQHSIPHKYHNTRTTHACADVIFFAWRTVDDKLKLAAPEIDVENG